MKKEKGGGEPKRWYVLVWFRDKEKKRGNGITNSNENQAIEMRSVASPLPACCRPVVALCVYR